MPAPRINSVMTLPQKFGSVCVFLICLSLFAATTQPAQSQAADEIGICSGYFRAERKVTCLVDGDTGWELGVKWRLLGVDTPEYKQNAECDAEPEYAKIATYRVLELLREGYEIEWIGKKGKLNRDLVRIRLADGRDLGQTLLSEGLAQPWPNDSNPWCNKPNQSELNM